VKRTEINELGEFGMINRINSKFRINQKTTVLGIGDDAAITNTDKELILTSSDMLVEGIHFDLSYTPLKHLGYKLVMVNLSDIFSMNCYPNHILINLAISNKFSVEAIDEIYDGIKYACDEYNIDLVGGDTSSSMSGLIMSCTVLGYGDKKQISYRNKAKADDIICVSGNLGRAYLGLLVLQREKNKFIGDPKNQPDLSKYKKSIEKQLRPKARKDIIDFFNLNKIVPNSMIDISDGLSSELLHISNSSNLGFKIFEEKLPIESDIYSLSKELNIDYKEAVLNGGEEYELLFSISLDKFENLDLDKIDITPIGHFTKNKKRIFVQKDGKNIDLNTKGWIHF
tara:strand:- start:7734 stop:8756 length:1023 start_codon:yes stop_codon:yes gene_type:complete